MVASQVVVGYSTLRHSGMSVSSFCGGVDYSLICYPVHGKIPEEFI
jgi:hypothetical protein